MQFEHNEVIVKLVCRHRYHNECLNDYVLSEIQPSCPACAGPCRILERYRHVVAAVHRADSFSSVQSRDNVLPDFVAPWYPAPNIQQPSGYYYAKTELGNGEIAALIDPGAWTSAAGEINGRGLTVTSLKHGYKPSQKKMETPLTLAGVGNGVQSCTWEAKIPVAIPDGDGSANLFDLETPLVGGSGSHLPIIMGLRTMTARNGVLEMGNSKEMLTFPGPGGYEIEWSPGAVHMP